MSARLFLPPNDEVRSSANLPLLRELHFMRQQLLRARTSLTLQIKSIERRLGVSSDDHAIDESQITPDTHASADSSIASDCATDESLSLGANLQNPASSVASLAALPLLAAKAPIDAEIKRIERRLHLEVRKLHVMPFLDGISGFGEIGLAQIIGEAGDLSNYSNPAKLWKRMGLHVFEGKAAKRSTTRGAEIGYSPVRRSIMFVIGESLIKKQNRYRDLYLTRKQYEEAKNPDATKMLWHRRAHRYMEKRLLLDLWKAWGAR